MLLDRGSLHNGSGAEEEYIQKRQLVRTTFPRAWHSYTAGPSNSAGHHGQNARQLPYSDAGQALHSPALHFLHFLRPPHDLVPQVPKDRFVSSVFPVYPGT
eukprot:1160628-Pelagomonas_calceolata.AAC.10